MQRSDYSSCSTCGSAAIIPIAYGLPDAKLMLRAEAGEVRLGGCVFSMDDPGFVCTSCGFEFGPLALEDEGHGEGDDDDGSGRFSAL